LAFDKADLVKHQPNAEQAKDRALQVIKYADEYNSRHGLKTTTEGNVMGDAAACRPIMVLHHGRTEFYLAPKFGSYTMSWLSGFLDENCKRSDDKAFWADVPQSSTSKVAPVASQTLQDSVEELPSDDSLEAKLAAISPQVVCPKCGRIGTKTNGQVKGKKRIYCPTRESGDRSHGCNKTYPVPLAAWNEYQDLHKAVMKDKGAKSLMGSSV
jgi:hypothetical protein